MCPSATPGLASPPLDGALLPTGERRGLVDWPKESVFSAPSPESAARPFAGSSWVDNFRFEFPQGRQGTRLRHDIADLPVGCAAGQAPRPVVNRSAHAFHVVDVGELGAEGTGCEPLPPGPPVLAWMVLRSLLTSSMTGLPSLVPITS